MSEASTPRISKLPFWIADALLLGVAGVLVGLGSRPLQLWEMALVTVCGGVGAWLAVMPYLKEYEARVKLAEADHLVSVTERLGQLDQVADRIAHATAQWQTVQDSAGKTAALSKEVVDRLSKEAESFAGAVLRTADGEKQTLKIEIEKLRRAEGEWLQSVGRLMDHVFALHVAALRSGQQGLIEQMDRFHAACRDALRRVGFQPIVAAPDEPFDARKHQAAEGTPKDGDPIDETLAPGFVFQGRLLRPIIVRMVGSAEAGTDSAASGGSVPASSNLVADGAGEGGGNLGSTGSSGASMDAPTGGS